jgi:nicotinamide mononucleotide (NMN) deamidase PncC
MKAFRWFAMMSIGLVYLGGCTAGSSAVLLSYDNIQAAAQEVQKGVAAYDTAVKADEAKLQAQVMAALNADILTLAQKQLSPADAKALADRVTLSMTVHLANFTEQEKRRSAVYSATLDNLQFILDICESGKNLELYRSNIDEQWKQYLAAQARAKLGRVPAAVLPTAQP